MVMKQTIIYILILIVLTACDQGLTVFQMRILIKNETGSTASVTVYPKSKYVRYGMYSYSDMHTIYKDTTFTADTKLGTELFSTDSLEMDPYYLVNKVFDSIYIKLTPGKILKFSPAGVVNYTENIFSDKSVWVYEKNILEHVRMWRDNNVESHDYTFILSKTKL